MSRRAFLAMLGLDLVGGYIFDAPVVSMSIHSDPTKWVKNPAWETATHEAYFGNEWHTGLMRHLP